jgi:hypothetical protein
METKEQEAKEAWREYTNKRFYDVSEGKNGAVKGSYQLTGISDFQTAIIEALEKRLSEIELEYKQYPSFTMRLYAEKIHIESFISLVKTVTPKKKS